MRQKISWRATAKLCVLTICITITPAANAQLPDRIDDLLQQARNLTRSAEDAAQDAATSDAGPIQNPFSLDNTVRSGLGIQDPTPGSLPGVEITGDAININVGGRSLSVPRTGPNPAHPSGNGIGHNHLASPGPAVGGLTINGQPFGGCLLRNGVANFGWGEVPNRRDGSKISVAGYRELAAGMAAFRSSDFAAAADLLQKSVAANPADPLPHPYYSLALFPNGNFDAAAEYAYSAAATSSVWDWSQLRSHYADPTQYAKHYEQLQVAARQTTATSGTHFLLAWHYLVLNDLENGQAELEKVLEMQPEEPLTTKLLEVVAAKVNPAGPPETAAVVQTPSENAGSDK